MICGVFGLLAPLLRAERQRYRRSSLPIDGCRSAELCTGNDGDELRAAYSLGKCRVVRQDGER